jgi:hypothetical protein
MKMSQLDQLCPWCQTEIVWDPEIGPEELCPHCLNELGDYRSVPLKIKQTGQQLNLDEEDDIDEIDGEDVDFDDDEDIQMLEEYEEGVQRVLDTQAEAPDCTSCQSLMLYAGNRTMALGFVPFVPPRLKQPLLKPSYGMKIFVCPSCFKVDHVLADEDRMDMIEQLKKHGSK